jgi:hypothetical protein
MTLIPDGNSWRIQGIGSQRARLAYAKLEGDQLIYTCEAPGQVI